MCLLDCYSMMFINKISTMLEAPSFFPNSLMVFIWVKLDHDIPCFWLSLHSNLMNPLQPTVLFYFQDIAAQIQEMFLKLRVCNSLRNTFDWCSIWNRWNWWNLCRGPFLNIDPSPRSLWHWDSHYCSVFEFNSLSNLPQIIPVLFKK